MSEKTVEEREFRWPFGVLETSSLLTLIVIIAIVCASFSQKERRKADWPQNAQTLPVEADISLGGQQYQLEIARTEWQKTVGLMHRASLPPNRGMAFVFIDRPQPRKFWLGNTYFPLDVVATRRGQVVNVFSNLQPCPPAVEQEAKCPIFTTEPADTSYELPAGAARGVKVGSTLFPVMRPKK